jgi:hypothetical protein
MAAGMPLPPFQLKNIDERGGKMLKHVFCLAMSCAAAFAVDGVHLNDQATVASSGGFPYAIGAPGSYRLSSNLSAKNTTAIVITAPEVTLDLNGFIITCVSCSGVPGIVSTGPMTSILNGTVTRFAGTAGKPIGIYFQATDGPQGGSRVDRVTVNGNGTGIQSDRGDLTVTECTASGNSTAGIYSAGNLTVRNSTASNNGLVGIVLNTGLVSGNLIVGNGNAVAGGLRGGIQANSAMITNNLIANRVFGVYNGTALVTGVAIGMNTFSGTSIIATANILTLGNNVCTATPGFLC